jgi:hypothetical protein
MTNREVNYWYSFADFRISEKNRRGQRQRSALSKEHTEALVVFICYVLVIVYEIY